MIAHEAHLINFGLMKLWISIYRFCRYAISNFVKFPFAKCIAFYSMMMMMM